MWIRLCAWTALCFLPARIVLECIVLWMWSCADSKHTMYLRIGGHLCLQFVCKSMPLKLGMFCYWDILLNGFRLMMFVCLSIFNVYIVFLVKVLESCESSLLICIENSKKTGVKLSILCVRDCRYKRMKICNVYERIILLCITKTWIMHTTFKTIDQAVPLL